MKNDSGTSKYIVYMKHTTSSVKTANTSGTSNPSKVLIGTGHFLNRTYDIIGISKEQ